MKKIILALMAVTTLSGVSGSASALVIRGTRSCGNWVELEKSNGQADAGASRSWLVGYLSGVVAGTGKDFLKDTDNESIYLWMTNYCKKNPLNNIAVGSEDLYFEMLKKKGIQ